MNKCDKCSLCCELFPVKWLNKAPLKKCKYQCKLGCAIQETKPDECSNFDCLFIQQELETELRPDKIGVVFEDVTTRIYLGTYKTPRVWENPIVKKYIEYNNKKGISILFSSFYLPNEIMIFATEEHTEEGVLRVATNLAKKRA